jgi:hypothetical protein
MEKIIKEGRFFTTEIDGKTYKSKFTHELILGKHFGDCSYYFTLDVWEIKHFSILGLKIPYTDYIHEYLAGSGKGCYSCGSFKYSSALDEFYLSPEDAKWFVIDALSNKKWKDESEAAKKGKENCMNIKIIFNFQITTECFIF